MGYVGGFEGYSGQPWGNFVLSWGHLGATLGGLEGNLGPPWGHLGPSWAILGLSLKNVGATWVHLGFHKSCKVEIDDLIWLSMLFVMVPRSRHLTCGWSCFEHVDISCVEDFVF